jgi:hypothetical protein
VNYSYSFTGTPFEVLPVDLNGDGVLIWLVGGTDGVYISWVMETAPSENLWWWIRIRI